MFESGWRDQQPVPDHQRLLDVLHADHPFHHAGNSQLAGYHAGGDADDAADRVEAGM
jgi:hypothetical protein